MFILVGMDREDVLGMGMNRHIWWDLFALLCAFCIVVPFFYTVVLF